MIGSSSTNFVDIVTIGERIENGVKSGKIADNVAHPTTNKKPHGNFTKKKEAETSVVMENVHPQFQSSITDINFLWLPCHIICIHMLSLLNINKLYVSINTRITIRNQHRLRMLRINRRLLSIGVKAKARTT